MKQREILKKIIEEKGDCSWIHGVVDVNDNPVYICHICPMGGKKSCVDYVSKRQGQCSVEDYIEVAKEMLTDIEVDRVLLGEEIEE